jgi:hypothetical protein
VRPSAAVCALSFDGERSSFPFDCFAVLGKPNAFRRIDLEKLEHSVCSRSVELRSHLFVFLRRHKVEDEITVGLHLPSLQHCESAFSDSQYVKHQKHEKQVKGHQKAQEHSQSEVKPKAFI